jgi:hypothetical protein
MRGFVITFDAAVAVLFIFVAAAFLFSQSFEPNAPRGVYLKQLTLDALTVMEKTGRLDRAIDGNSTAVLEVMGATPDLACMQITIGDSVGNTVATITKVNCGEVGRELQTAAMPMVHNGNSYMVRAQSWYKKG